MTVALTTGINTAAPIYGVGSAAVLNPLVYQAMDVTGNTFVPTGRTFLFVRSTDGSTHTFTLTGIADQYGAVPATGTITVPAGVLATGAGEIVMGPFPAGGPWCQANGTVIITPSSALLFIAVLNFPG